MLNLLPESLFAQMRLKIGLFFFKELGIKPKQSFGYYECPKYVFLCLGDNIMYVESQFKDLSKSAGLY